jgi:hypothetical protein
MKSIRKPDYRDATNPVIKLLQTLSSLGQKRPRPRRYRYREIVPC